METARRGYKLQEFVAHESDVNCLNIGKKSSRLFITGGVDRKVNLWTIGQTSSLLSLLGHTSSIESVTFDSAEVLVLAGAYSGAVKLWDIEEGKIVRTLTGHRGSCDSVEFHPFGEFFASGSSDNDLKIWDIRRKGCIHTYKGHSGAIKTVKFTPDGRWVVSGGEDNIVKLWDLTAGKQLHEFKAHSGAIRSINFHPHEFLLATGSADRTVKFWDLETFEMIGTAAPEMTGVRSMIFHPDGKTLFCGLDETLKVFSWEPLRCHDAVDLKWSILGDISIYEGKLLGCSYHQSSAAIWVADISLISPYTIGQSQNFHLDLQPKTSTAERKTDDVREEVKETIKSVYITSSDDSKGASQFIKHVETLSMSPRKLSAFSGRSDTTSSPLKSDVKVVLKESLPRSKSVKELKSIEREGISGDSKKISLSQKSKVGSQRSSNTKVSFSSRIVMPVVIAKERESSHMAKTTASGKEMYSSEATFLGNLSSTSNLQRRFSQVSNSTLIQNKEPGSVATPDSGIHSARAGSEELLCADEKGRTGILSDVEKLGRILSPEKCSLSVDDKGNESSSSSTYQTQDSLKNFKGGVQHGRTRSLVESWEKIRANPSPLIQISEIPPSESNAMLPTMGGTDLVSNTESRSYDDGSSDALLQNHDSLINTLKSRLMKLQMVRHLWTKSGVEGAFTSIVKLPDNAVQVDVVSILTEKVDIFTLDLFSLLLPLLAALLNCKTERHIDISLEMLVKLVRVFGSMIRMTALSPLPVGVDLYAEERQKCCRLCLDQLEKIKQELPSLIKKGGSIARRSVELNMALQQD